MSDEQKGAEFSSSEASGSETSDSDHVDERRLRRARKQNDRQEVQAALHSLSETVQYANEEPSLHSSNVSIETVIPYAIDTIEKFKGKAKKNRARERRNNSIVQRNVDLLKSIQMMEKYKRDGIMTPELKDVLKGSEVVGSQSGASGSKDDTDNYVSSSSSDELPDTD